MNFFLSHSIIMIPREPVVCLHLPETNILFEKKWLITREKKEFPGLYIYVFIWNLVMLCARVGTEFPDMRQNERRVKFINVGYVVRTGGWLMGEPTPFMG